MIDHPSNGLFVNPTPQTREDCLPSEDPERANSDSSLTSITCKGDAHYSAISARVGRKTKPKHAHVAQWPILTHLVSSWSQAAIPCNINCCIILACAVSAVVHHFPLFDRLIFFRYSRRKLSGTIGLWSFQLDFSLTLVELIDVEFWRGLMMSLRTVKPRRVLR